MTNGDILEAKYMTIQAQDLLGQVRKLAHDTPEVIDALANAQRQLEEVETALWSTEPQPDDNPIIDRVEECRL